MKIALFGYGRMGKIARAVCAERGHETIACDPQAPDADHREATAQILRDVDCCIDFSHPAAVMSNIKLASDCGKNLVVGTTGWYDNLPAAKTLVTASGIGFLYGANFSIGVNLFFRIAAEAAALFDRAGGYDVCGVEYHHRKKADSPSGTALSLAKILLEHTRRKEKAVFDIVNRPIEEQELHFASVRCGSIPGTHEVLFDSDADTVSLRHTVRNRQGLALGAVKAAEWLQGKTGFFTVEDMMADVFA